MAKKPSKEMQARLAEQTAELASGGVIIRNKEWGKGVLRILPTGGKGDVRRLPGLTYYDYFSRSANKGSASPRSWGLPCPLYDAHQTVVRALPKKEREAAYDAVKPGTEIWCPVILRRDDTEEMRIFRTKKTVYDKVREWMQEDEIDILDADEGVDLIVKKKGEGRDTKWAVERGAEGPISEDEESYDRLCELGRTTDVKAYFFEPDWPLIAEMYYELTGEDLPGHYEEAWDEEHGGEGDYEDEEGQESEEDDNAWAKGDACQFESDGETLQGVYVTDDGETADVDVDGEEYEVPLEDLEEVDADDDGEDADAEEGDADEEGDDADAPEDGFTEGDSVTFVSDGETYTGTYQEDDGTDADVEVDGELWSVVLEDLEAADDSEGEDDPEEEPPAVSRASKPDKGAARKKKVEKRVKKVKKAPKAKKTTKTKKKVKKAKTVKKTKKTTKKAKGKKASSKIRRRRG